MVQSVKQRRSHDRIRNATDRKPWRNAAEKDDRAWKNNDAWNVNHDSNAVRDTIDDYIAKGADVNSSRIN